MLTTAANAHALNLTPLCKIVATANAALEPAQFTLAISTAITKLLEQTHVALADVDRWEMNEAFSVTPLANVAELARTIGQIDVDRLNVHGGAVAMGHPLG